MSASKRFLTAIYPTSYILIVILLTLHFILYTNAYFILVIYTLLVHPLIFRKRAYNDTAT